MTAQLSSTPVQKFFDNNGFPLFLGTLSTYAAGTTTPQATYVDSTQTTQNTNPIELNFRGECNLWLNPVLSYKFVLKDVFGNIIWTVDNIAGGFVPGSQFTAAIIAALLAAYTAGPILASYSQTAAEIAASVTPTNYSYPSGDSRRFNFDLTGATNDTTLLQGMLNAAGISAADTGLVNEVTLWPGTYLVNRVYINYSNVFLKIMPGAVIKQTLTGITNSNTTGTTPAYAVIHINPLTYTVNPSSAITAINNVKVYGGGTVQGPNTTAPGSYQQFQMGIASNDCNKCWVQEITVQGCGAENVLLNPSGWNTCTDLRIDRNEILQGGEVGINNARQSQVTWNEVHDSWFQNGVGADGDQIIVGFNKIRNMAGGALIPGGSGAHDINESRDVLYIGNICTATGLSIAGTYAMFASDDGATTVPKYNHRYIGNTFDAHNGPIGIGCDYNTALNICIENNTVTSLVFAGGAGADFEVVAGSGQYYLRGNNFNPGLTGNAGYGVTNSSAGTPTINIEQGNDISGHATANINWSVGIVLKGEFTGQFNGTLTGFSGGTITSTITFCKEGNEVTLNWSSVNGTSNATTMTMTGLPAYLIPTRSQNFNPVLTDNGTNGFGIMQVGSSGTITFFKDINGSAFTASGTKGLTAPGTLTYLLN